jgi:alkylated DNA repair dioxygenase AlkB
MKGVIVILLIATVVILDWVASLSLGSGILMDFRGPQGETRQVWLPARDVNT